MSAVRAIRRCSLYIPGHTVHFIQAIHSLNRPERPRSGRIVSIQPGIVTVDLGAERRRYRNHDTPYLRDLVRDHGTAVNVDEGWSLLRLLKPGGGYCFSIDPADRSRRRCVTDELTRFDAEGIRERLLSHGGLVLPGGIALEAVADRTPPARPPEDPHGGPS